MKTLEKVIEIKFIDVTTIDDRLQAIKDDLSLDEALSWKSNDRVFIFSSALSDENYDAVEAIFAADNVSNEEIGAKKHREIKAIESCIDSVTDANVKQSLQCILNYIKLLHEE
jgi:hypothetical protein